MVSWLVKQGNYIVKCSVIPSVNLISPAFAVQMFGFLVNRRAIKTAIFCHFSHVLPFAQIAHPVFVHFARNPHPVRMACQTLHNAPQAPQRSGYAPALPASAPALVLLLTASHGYILIGEDNNTDLPSMPGSQLYYLTVLINSAFFIYHLVNINHLVLLL